MKDTKTTQCQAQVYNGSSSFNNHVLKGTPIKGCTRNAAIDGYCKQHHPDSIKARRDKADTRRLTQRLREHANCF